MARPGPVHVIDAVHRHLSAAAKLTCTQLCVLTGFQKASIYTALWYIRQQGILTVERSPLASRNLGRREQLYGLTLGGHMSREPAVPSPAGHMARGPRKPNPGGKMRMHRTVIEHHDNGGHTAKHEYGPVNGPSYMGQKDQSHAFGGTSALLKHLKAKLTPDQMGPPMANGVPPADTDKDGM